MVFSKHFSNLLLSLGLVIWISMWSSVFATTTYSVTINTTAVNGTRGKVVFDFITNNPHRPGNHVQILNFSAGGTLGLPESLGGLVSGSLILGANPAPFTVIDADFFFNELTVNHVAFGDSITFQLQLPELPPPSGEVPDEFALFILDATGRPLFQTADPLEANALFAIDITGAPGGNLSVFSPTVFQSPSTLQIVVPSSNRPPDCSQARPSVASLWPPDHKMVPISILGVTDPDGDPVTIRIDQIKQNEPTNGVGDGDTCPDGEGVGTSTAQLRAERSGTGNGRVYTVFFTASDGRGGSCQANVKVCVPHDRQSSCVDGEPKFDSTICP